MPQINENRFADFIRFYKNKQIKTLDRYIYCLEKIPESVFDSIRRREDLNNLQTWLIQNEGRNGFSFMKNYKLVYYGVKLYLNFKGKQDIANYLDKSHIPRGGKNTILKHWDPETVNKLIENAKYKLQYKSQLDENQVLRPYKNKWAISLKPKFEADRDTLFIKFLYRTGARCSEATQVKLADINIEKKTVTILGKGGKTREALITAELIQEIKLFCRENSIDEFSIVFDFMKGIPSKGEKLNNLVSKFGDKKGKKIYESLRALGRAEVMIKKVGKLCVQNRIITPHQARHGLAMLLHMNNVPLDRIQVALGHSNIATTMIYAKTTIEDVRESYDRIQNNQ